MKTALCISGALLIGLLIGWFGGTYHQAKSTQEAVLLFKVIELDNAEKRAKEAYAKQPRNVAIWELNHLVDVFQEALKAQFEGPKSVRLKLFLAHARLARVFDLEGSQEQAGIHFDQAILYYNGDHPDAKIEDFQTLLERLQKFDEIAKIN